MWKNTKLGWISLFTTQMFLQKEKDNKKISSLVWKTITKIFKFNTALMKILNYKTW